jgi:hypothetical protein
VGSIPTILDTRNVPSASLHLWQYAKLLTTNYRDGFVVSVALILACESRCVDSNQAIVRCPYRRSRTIQGRRVIRCMPWRLQRIESAPLALLNDVAIV